MAAPKATILSEIMRGKSFELVNDVYNIGRTEDNDICIPDGTLSSKHCQLVREESTFKVIDHGSTNGTRINGERISESYLKSADILQVGGIEILFDCEGPASVTSTASKTGIDLQVDTNFDSQANMVNITPLGTSKVSANDEKGGAGFKVGLILLGLVVAGLVAFYVMQVMGNK